MDDIVSICCFSLKARDDKIVELGQGPWVTLRRVTLRTYAGSRHSIMAHSVATTVPIVSRVLMSLWRPIVRRPSGRHRMKLSDALCRTSDG